MRPICQALVHVSTPHNSLTWRFPAFGPVSPPADNTSSSNFLKEYSKFAIPVCPGYEQRFVLPVKLWCYLRLVGSNSK